MHQCVFANWKTSATPVTLEDRVRSAFCDFKRLLERKADDSRSLWEGKKIHPFMFARCHGIKDHVTAFFVFHSPATSIAIHISSSRPEWINHLQMFQLFKQ